MKLLSYQITATMSDDDDDNDMTIHLDKDSYRNLIISCQEIFFKKKSKSP